MSMTFDANGCQGGPLDRPDPKDPFEQKLAANRALSRDEFAARFKARMLKTAGERFDDGSSIAEYADEVGPSYWDDEGQREDGPEDCADSDMSYWGE